LVILDDLVGIDEFDDIDELDNSNDIDNIGGNATKDRRMKQKTVRLPSIYDEDQHNRVTQRFKKYSKIKLILLLFLLLAAFRFMNLGMWWYVNKAEMSETPVSLGSGKTVHYTFLGFSTQKKAVEECRDLSRRLALRYPGDIVTVAAYFNFLHPAIFEVLHKGKIALVDLGKTVVAVSGGQSSYTVCLSDFIQKRKEGKSYWGHLGTSFLLNMFTGVPADITVTTDKAPEGLSFYAKTADNSTYLKIPYLTYFYLPLVLIIIMAFFNSPAVLTSFFYYVGLFLLFDFRRDLFSTPLKWLIDLLKLEIEGYTDLIGSLAVVALFVFLGVIGLMNWKKIRAPFQERLTIMFFLILPIFLRF
jgi:hypothetical protein